MTIEKWEIESLEMDMKAIQRQGIKAFKGDESLIRRLEKLANELKEASDNAND